MATKIEKAKVQLLIRHPFFGSIVMKRPFIMDDSVGTACVGRDGQIKISPKFAESLTVQQLVFLLAHEAMHVVYAHLARMGDRDPEVWNIATDAVINDMLQSCSVGAPIEGCVSMPGSKDKTAEAVYAELMKNAKPQGGSGGSGAQGDGQGKGPLIKDIRPEEAKGITKEQAARAVTEGKIEIAKAAQTARMQGKLSGGLAKLIEEYIKTTIPWHQVLERFMTGKAERHLSWNRPNKRFLKSAYMPRRDRLPSMGEIVVGIDVSGSISDREVARFMGHLNGIIEQCHPEKVHVLYVTSEVELVETFEEQDYPIKPTSKRFYGGTDMCEVVRWTEDNAPDAELVVTFTDGWTDWPRESPCDLVWVITDKNVTADRVPLGEVLYDEEQDA